MDAYIAPHLLSTPIQVLTTHGRTLSRYTAWHFGCSGAESQRCLRLLACADGLLRGSLVPRACYHAARRHDPGLDRRLRAYLRETACCLATISRVLEGETPAWPAERTHETLGVAAMAENRRLPTPREMYQAV
ncbi:MAG: hypothetical protein ACREUA_08825 [Burkholderiales bacterium]